MRGKRAEKTDLRHRQADLFLRLAQGGGHRAVIFGVDLAAGK